LIANVAYFAVLMPNEMLASSAVAVVSTLLCSDWLVDSVEVIYIRNKIKIQIVD